MIWIDFGDIWQKYSEYSRTEFACFSFHVGLLEWVGEHSTHFPLPSISVTDITEGLLKVTDTYEHCTMCCCQ